MSTPRRSGYSLVEVLVVLGILAILVGMMLPAVQRAREAANRTACANNLRQIALATHQYHDSYQALPAGMRWRGGTDPCAYMSWLAQLLAYLEQQPLWQRTSAAYQQTAGMRPPYFPATGPHAEPFATPIVLFSCPSDGRAAQAQTMLIGGVPHPVALTSYLGVNGRNFTTRDGVLFADSQVRLATITDGTSQTLLAGERPPSADHLWGWWYAASGQEYTGSCQFLLGAAELRHSDTPNPCANGVHIYAAGTLDNICDIYHFWSLHPGGANFAFADGGVRFLTYAAAPSLPALASRSAGDLPLLPE